MPAYAAGLFAILTVATTLRTAAQVTPAINVTNNGTQVDGNLNITGDLTKNGVPYAPPLSPATTTTIGGVKVGSGLNVAPDGTLSTTGGATTGGFSIIEAANAAQAGTLSLQNPATLYVVPTTGAADGSIWFAGKLILSGGGSSQPASVLLTPAMTGPNTPAPFAATSNTSYTTPNAYPWMAFDQSSAGIFHSGPGQISDLWLVLDLGQSRNFRHVKMYSRADSFQQDTPNIVTISTSTDGVTWVQQNVFGGIPQPATPNYLFLDEALSFTARYIRFNFDNNRSGNRGYQAVNEIELYGY